MSRCSPPRSRTGAPRTSGEQKLKKDGERPAASSRSSRIPDILATVAQLQAKRPTLVVGFAAETEKVVEHAKAKLERKGCDWIVANDVSAEGGVMGGDSNTVHLISTADGVESWPPQSKDEVARQLVARIAAALDGKAAMSASIVKIMRLPHGADLPLPAYQSDARRRPRSAGRGPADAPVTIAPGRRAPSRPASRSRCRAGTEAQVRPRSGLARNMASRC